MTAERDDFGLWPALLAPLGLLLCVLRGHPKVQPINVVPGAAFHLYCRRCYRWRNIIIKASTTSSGADEKGEGVRKEAGP